MKTTTLNNAEIVIQANTEKAGDWEKVLEVAKKMCASEWIDMEMASQDDSEQWVHICACWDNYQAGEIKEAYRTAKAA